MTRFASHPVDDEGWTGWITPVQPAVYRLGCCDCGLVHDLVFEVRDGLVRYRARRNERSTAAKRSWRKRRAS